MNRPDKGSHDAATVGVSECKAGGREQQPQILKHISALMSLCRYVVYRCSLRMGWVRRLRFYLYISHL